MKIQFGSMTAGLVAAITAAVVVACAGAAYVYSTHHFETMLETARTAALTEGDLIRVALEHQMMENDRSLISRMIASFGRQARVEKVTLLDRNGVERFSSDPQSSPAEFRIESETCQACHRHPPDQRGSSRVIETRGGEILRTVIPIRNGDPCRRCHDPSHEINGVLILDYNAGEIRAAMTRDLNWMVAGSGAIALLLITTIALVVRITVLRRLQRFETTARLIAAGDLDRRVPARGSDTVAWLAREFNTMADSMAGLIGEVRAQRERLETVINSVDDGIVVLNAERKVIAANQAFLRRTGRSIERLLGCGCTRMTPDGCAVDGCPALECLQTGERQVRICECRSADGATVWEEVHASPILDETGKAAHVVEVWRDISDRCAAEARLAESHRLASLGMLASGFSHELNTPLATVLTCVEGILREIHAGGGPAPDLGRIGENASIAREQILRCRGITGHFLRMSRGQSSPGEIIDLNAAITAVERLVEPTAREHSVKVEVVAAGQELRALADEAELQHALVNLLLNAVQASRAGGRVVVGASVAGNEIRIRVADEGPGIAPEYRKRIFEPFFSLRKGGTGLGLFLALNSVRRWGGDIRIESKAGKGSSFEVVLPAPGAAQQEESA